MLLNFSCLVFSLFATFAFASEDSSSSYEWHERTLSDGDLILRRYCKSKPESPLCGFVVTKNTETVFPPNSNSIVHSRSERDDSESYLPITSEDLAEDKTSHLLAAQQANDNRKKRYIPYGMMGGYGGYPGMGYGMGHGMGMGYGMGHGMGMGYGMGYGMGMGGFGGYRPFGYGGPFGIQAHRGFGVMTPIGPIGAYRSFSLGFGK